MFWSAVVLFVETFFFSWKVFSVFTSHGKEVGGPGRGQAALCCVCIPECVCVFPLGTPLSSNRPKTHV